MAAWTKTGVSLFVSCVLISSIVTLVSSKRRHFEGDTTETHHGAENYLHSGQRHRSGRHVRADKALSEDFIQVFEAPHQLTLLESYGGVELPHLRRRRAVTNANISVTVPENTNGSLFNINTYVTNIGARQYVITESSVSSAMFEVTSSGQVSLKQGQVLDYENTAMRSIRLVIQATSPTNSSDVYAITVVMSVTNVNEPPVFVTKPTPYLARVTSSAGTGSIVTNLTAVDPELNSNVQYQIVSVNPTSFSSGFQIGTISETDPTYGSVTSCQVRTNDASVLKPDGTDITIIISASDGTNPTQTSVAVRVGLREPQIYQSTFSGVIPENNQPDQMVYIQGSENSPLVIQVKRFQEGELTYELRSSGGTESGKFYVSGDGIVRSRVILDLESLTSSTEQMTVIVRQLIGTTTTLSSTGTVTVTIQDMNDNSPVFDIPQYTTRISEDTAIGASILEVKAFDRDSGSNSAIDYSFIEAPNTTDSFNITTVQRGNDYIGIIKVKKTLDYDRRPLHLYEFKVVAIDRGKPTSLSGTTNVQVIVTNVNDEAPEFITRPDPIRVQDTTAVGQVIIQMQARDLDGDRVKYYFTPSLSQVYRFTINQDTGIITLTQQIQTIDTSFVLNITAVDDGSCCGSSTSMSSSTSIVVQVVGSNTHKPTFTWCANYSLATVTENSPNGTFIVTVHADDPDRGENGKVTYELTQPTGKFGINSDSGNVTVIVPIDREKETSKFIQVTVKASDNGQPRLDGWCTFRVEIIDVNDNSPVFDKTEYVANITSDTQVNQTFTVIRANDSDTGANAEIEYSLVSDVNGAFGIISTNGFIYPKKPLLTNTTTYKLIAMAKDKGVPPLNTTVSITVNIKVGLSNQQPAWDKDYNNLNITSIEQTRPDTPIISDLRCRSNVINDTRVEFQLIAEDGIIGTRSNYFYIQDNGTSVTLYTISNLNYEQQAFQIIRLRCLNYGPLALWSEINPRIQLIDQNNKVPIFTGIDSNGRYSGSVGENVTGIQDVITVQAEDADSSPTFRNLSFEIVQDYGDDSTSFSIAPSTNDNRSALIKTTRIFDREVKNFYTIKVRVKDGAPSVIQPYEPFPNTATVVVQIYITDINDNPPSFKLPLYNLTVREDHDLLTPILPAITADDLDEINIGRLEYFIVSGNGVPPAFGISTGTGLFYLVRKLDYENGDKSFQLVLRAYDGIYSATTTVTITVLDVNDNSPTFSQNPYNVNDIVEEDQNLNGNLPILQVNATDADVNRPDEIRYSLLIGRDSKYFRIDQVSGQLYLTSTLDRDRQEGPSFSITVQAVDEPTLPNYGYTTVIVSPKDINDNDPSFKTSPLQGSVKENSPPNTSVMLIQAQDPDQGENGTVYFQINRIFSPPNVEHAGYFLIDRRSGIIWTNASSDKLDRERESTYYLVTVIYDGGNPPRSSTGTVTIFLDDINDNSPVFQQRIYRTDMSENQRAGTIITVRANDSDIGDNARLTYRFVSTGNGTQYFQIDSINNEGIINIYKPVDYEDPSQRFFNLTVSVEDPNPSHNDTCYVEITVTDFNDNAPEITMQWALKDVSEAAPVDTLIANFTARDRDSGINGQFEFSIARDSDRLRQFKIVRKDQFSAEVRIRQPLDRETISSYNLRILAIDGGNPQMTGSAIISLDIRDVNDNYPTFKDNYQPQVRENLANPRTLVQKILGKDPDASPYGPPFGFRLGSCSDKLCLCTSTPSCQEFEFSTNNDDDGGNGSASVYSLVEFDREKQKYYLIPVVMWDMRGTNKPESMTGTNTLTVTIGDVNDNPMSAGHQNMFVYNYKGLFGDIEIGRVYVQDLDDWDLPDKTFTFVEPDWMKAYFTVNPRTGMVTMKKGVPNNLGGKPYTFTVDVTDSVWNSKVRSSVSVIIKDLSEQAVASSGAVRLSGTSAEEFIKRPQTGESQYDTFRKLLAQKFQTTVDNVQIVSIMNVGEYTDVRYSAHGSPYYQSSQIDSILVANKDQFESGVNIKIVMVPIDTCTKEVFEGGCYNFINITGHPILVNSNGTSYVGVEVLVQTKEGCRGEKFPDPEQCSGNYCYHGGTCLKDDFGKLSCQCLSEFDGPRCQQLRHSFNGTGYAMYPTLEQCENSQTSLEFITTQGQGLLLYNGPTEELTADQPQDFISLELAGGYPVLNINHGSGALTLTLTTTNTLADGKWHRIDIYRQGRNVEMVVDFCKTAAASNSTWLDTRSCRAVGQTPGDNSFLNVATLLQLGGRHSTPSYPPNIGSSPFNGCVRNLRHNTKLYDLYFKNLQGTQSGENGCPHEDSICGTTCGTNGACSASFTPPAVQSCVCKPGFRGSNCNTATTVRDLRTSSYLQWTFNPTAAGVLPYELEIQAMFRTRDDYGAIFSISNADNSKTIILEIVNNTLQVTYNLGSGDQVLKLLQAAVSNGQWHVVNVKCRVQHVTLSLDGGEGHNYATSRGSLDSPYSMTPSGTAITGAVLSSPALTIDRDLINTCIQDIRVNNIAFPMKASENIGNVVQYIREQNMFDGCTRDGCGSVTCPSNMVCYPLWDKGECRCNHGYHLTGSNVCITNCDPNPCFSGMGCTTSNGSVVCNCTFPWYGTLCQYYPLEETTTPVTSTPLITTTTSTPLITTTTTTPKVTTQAATPSPSCNTTGGARKLFTLTQLNFDLNSSSTNLLVIGSRLDLSSFGNSPSVKLALYPPDSFLQIQTTDNKTFSVYTTSVMPEVTKNYHFFLEAEVMSGNEIARDFAHLTVNFKRFFPTSPPVRVSFVLDGMRKGGIIYDLSTVLGNVEGLGLTLSSNPNTNLYDFSPNRTSIVCNRDVRLSEFRSNANSIAHQHVLNISTSQGTVLTLYAVIVLNRYSKQISENSPNGTLVADFASLSNDFSISGVPTTDQIFVLTSTNVTLGQKLNYENPAQKQFKFNISLVLKSNIEAKTEIETEVIVTDVNDEPPEFKKYIYPFSTWTGAVQNQVIGFLEVTDIDSVSGFSYTIEPTEYSKYFEVLSTNGVLQSKVDLKNLGSSVIFNVSVSDGPNKSLQSAKVTISIFQSQNDNLTVVGNSTVVSVQEEEPPGKFITNASMSNYIGYRLLPDYNGSYVTIDAGTGVITTTARLDREDSRIPQLIFSVLAYHKDNACDFKIVRKITIVITDINDNSPSFTMEGSYSTSLPENSSIGTTVFQVLASDKDLGNNASILFSLYGQSSAPFSIGNQSGIITVANPFLLDREQNDTFRVVVIAMDGGSPQRSANATLTIRLIDVNDNSPVFDKTQYTFTILENRPASVTVGNVSATDKDIGLNGEIGYFYTGPDSFVVNRTSGIIRTTRLLDRELTTNYSLTIYAYDNGSPRREASCTVMITVNDVNDNAPKFERQYYLINISEGNDCSHSAIATLRANDPDEGLNGQVFYTITNSVLTINSSTGMITCKASGLDYEISAERDFIVQVTATDRGSPPLTGSVSVRVKLTDVNDNAPVFTGHPYNVSLPTEIFGTPNATVYVVSATDRDSNENGAVFYTLTTTVDEVVNLLWMDTNTGVIRVNKTASTFQHTSYEFSVVASDRGHPPMTDTTSLFLNITNVASTIKFSQSDFHITIEERKPPNVTTPVGKLHSLPTGPPAKFTLAKNPVLYVDTSSGYLFCNVTLDRETLASYEVLATVEDNTSHSYAIVFVTVSDVNDNPPEFHLSEVQMVTDIVENSESGTFIITITADDADEGNNSVVSYYLPQPNIPFAVGVSDGRLTVDGSLDREQSANYTVVVLAKDNGFPPLSTSATVTIYITDVNDNTPKFLTPDIKPIPEDASWNMPTWSAVVEATDPDYGDNGKVKYAVLNTEACPFTINNVGKLNLQDGKTLDYETTTSHTCIIQASDSPDSGALSSNITVIINVTDVNDNDPVFQHVIKSHNVSRDVGIPYPILANLSVTDADSGKNAEISFDIDNSTFAFDLKWYFNINAVSGEITIQKPLSDFPLESVNLTIVARDSGETVRTATEQIEVFISDENSPPTFNPDVYSKNIEEENITFLFEPLLTVMASDYENQTLVNTCNCTYVILSTKAESGLNVSNYFSIDSSTGTILLTRDFLIDREKTGNYIDVRLKVTDKGMPPKSDTATLWITVWDINDNAPVFDRGDIDTTITKSKCKHRQVIYNATAHDADIYPNNIITYRLNSHQSLSFTGIEVNGTTGELLLIYPNCSNENIENERSLVVISATDGKYNTSLTISINVNLSDSNPNGPVFSKQLYYVTVLSNSPNGTILQIPDFGVNDNDGNNVTFAIEKNNLKCTEDVFRINSATGKITLQSKLDQFSLKAINLTITAADYGDFSPRYSKTGTTTVSVTVSDYTEKVCIATDKADELQSKADQFTVFRGLFIAIVLLWAITIVVSVALFYKWRVVRYNLRAKQSDIHTFDFPPLDNDAGKGSKGKADTTGLPPELPRREGSHGISSGDSGFRNPAFSIDQDKDGYLAPSEHGTSTGQFSSADSILSDLSLGSSRDTYAGGAAYMPLLPEGKTTFSQPTYLTPSSVIRGKADDPKGTYLHAVPEEQGPEKSTYLHATVKPDDIKPYF